VIALADEMKRVGVNYQQHLHVTAVNVHGNSLSIEEHSRWYTPAHIMGGWSYKAAPESRGRLRGDRCARKAGRPGRAR
jgi:hypothetical protein